MEPLQGLCISALVLTLTGLILEIAPRGHPALDSILATTTAGRVRKTYMGNLVVELHVLLDFQVLLELSDSRLVFVLRREHTQRHSDFRGVVGVDQGRVDLDSSAKRRVLGRRKSHNLQYPQLLRNS